MYMCEEYSEIQLRFITIFYQFYLSPNYAAISWDIAIVPRSSGAESNGSEVT